MSKTKTPSPGWTMHLFALVDAWRGVSSSTWAGRSCGKPLENGSTRTGCPTSGISGRGSNSSTSISPSSFTQAAMGWLSSSKGAGRRQTPPPFFVSMALMTRGANTARIYFCVTQKAPTARRTPSPMSDLLLIVMAMTTLESLAPPGLDCTTLLISGLNHLEGFGNEAQRAGRFGDALDGHLDPSTLR